MNHFQTLPERKFSARRSVIEHAKLNFQLNAYNVFNKFNLNPTPTTLISNDGVTSNPQFGQVQGAFAGRIVELQARFSF